MNDITALMQCMKAAAKQSAFSSLHSVGMEVAVDSLDFIELTTPANVLALVEELEKAQRYIDRLREWNANLAYESCEYQKRIAELERGASEPVAWVRYCSDGTIDGPLMNYQIEDCRKSTWTPLYTVPPALESRTVTVKLPAVEKWRKPDAVRAQNAYRVLVINDLAAVGINVEAD